MQFMLMAADIILYFRVIAMETGVFPANSWHLDVTTIEEVGGVLVELGALTTDEARRLSQGCMTIRPHPGLHTLPLTALAELGEMLNPERDPPSAEAQEGFMLLAATDTTEEKLLAMGFVLRPGGELQ